MDGRSCFLINAPASATWIRTKVLTLFSVAILAAVVAPAAAKAQGNTIAGVVLDRDRHPLILPNRLVPVVDIPPNIKSHVLDIL